MGYNPTRDRDGSDPTLFPGPWSILEPIIKVFIMVPGEYIGDVMQLVLDHRSTGLLQHRNAGWPTFGEEIRVRRTHGEFFNSVPHRAPFPAMSL